MAYLILHLSDIHIKDETDSILLRAEAIAKTTFAYLSEVQHIFIIISGDIAFSGKEKQYVLAENFLNEISDTIRIESKINIDFIVCPGNHDCDFSLPQSVRNKIIKTIKDDDIDAIDYELIDVCTEVQNNFFDFRNRIERGDCTDDKLWRTHIFNFGKKKIQINSLNVAWMSELHEKQANLQFPISRYEDNNYKDSNLIITVMHHPFNWFEQTTYRRFRSLIKKNSDLVITGHEHIGNVGTIYESENEQSSFIEGSALQESDEPESRFNIVKLNIDTEEFCLTQYEWDKNSYKPSTTGQWSAWHPLPISNNKPFKIKNEFQRALDDPGAFIKHPFTTSIVLSDIFIYPDLKVISNNSAKDKKEIISSKQLIENITSGEHFIIEGEEKSGRTSLMMFFYTSLHEQDKVPVYIKASDFNKSSSSDIEKIIYRAVKKQYEDLESYKQLPSSSKVLLLDDFDDIPIKNEKSQVKLMTHLKSHFSKIFITVDEMFEMKDFLEASSVAALDGMSHFIIQPFGYQRRADFIKKWFALGQNGSVSEAEFIAQCDKAERLLDAVMSKMIIPSSPLYLITLLQSINSQIYSDFQHSSLAEYYRFLLTNALQEIGVHKDKLTESIDYASHLAWEYHKKSTHVLSKLELLNFNKEFSDEWYTVDFEKKLEELQKARVLIKSGEDYAFHYPYIYFYLKGFYISQNLNNSEIKEYIKHCCEHLYVREYANTILFVAHHIPDSFVIDCIVDSYKKIFIDQMPMHFNSDTEKVNSIIKGAPELSYNGESPEVHRNKNHRIKDDLPNNNDGLIDQEEESENLSMLAQLTMLFKSSEILGQVIKNQYSKIQRSKKREYIEELFNGPLRALSKFYDIFLESPELLASEIERELSKKHKNLDKIQLKEFAKKVTTQLILLISASFIMKAAQSAGSDSLLENVNEAVINNNTIGFRLIELAILLDSPNPIPKEKLSRLLRDIDNDLITNRIIKILVINRLYMFKTTESDMQWLTESQLKIALSTQHSISYKKKNLRLINNKN